MASNFEFNPNALADLERRLQKSPAVKAAGQKALTGVNNKIRSRALGKPLETVRSIAKQELRAAGVTLTGTTLDRYCASVAAGRPSSLDAR